MTEEPRMKLSLGPVLFYWDRPQTLDFYANMAEQPLDLIPELSAIGVTAMKIEGRQRSPAYVEQVTRVWRAALDSYLKAPQRYAVEPGWRQVLDGLSEGSQTTLGAYHRAWQ
jgi:collagenase-like PrtC family protease